MNEGTKDWIEYGSAIVMLLSGVIMSFLCFFMNNHNINESVLWYTSQTLIYAGSIFGVKIYIHSKIGEIKNDIEKIIKDKK